MKDTYTDEEREKAWERITLTVEKYSDELVEQWNKQIDGLLTFVRAEYKERARKRHTNEMRVRT